MTVEILQSDSPEEKERKLQAFWNYRQKKEETKREERDKRLREFLGSVKSDIDPLEWQRRVRSEWDDRFPV